MVSIDVIFRVLATGVLAGALLGACGKSASGGSRVSIAAAGGLRGVSIIQQGPGAVVYRRDGAVYGRLRGGQPKVLVAAGDRLTLLRLAGRFVAVAWFATDPYGGGSGEELDVVDLSNGHSTEASAWDRSSPGAFPDVVLTRRGSIAWIEAEPTPQIFRCLMGSCSSGARSRVDRGTAIGVRSLRLRGNRLSWVHGHTRRTASLP